MVKLKDKKILEDILEIWRIKEIIWEREEIGKINNKII